MSLAAIGNGASYEFRWRSWALLRDVIVAALDGGEASYPCFSSLGDAIVSGKINVNAGGLAGEVNRLREALAGRPLDELVIGPRTAQVLYWGVTPKTRRPLTRNEIENIRPVGDSSDLAEYFATMLDSLDRVCGHPASDGTIEIIDG
ncbi:MAG TPA: hypothetical protein VIU61_11065 [Kofleriaceae bacterium]